MIYDLVIIGGGPAGITSAIYAKRALLKIALFEKETIGGKLNKTKKIENYPGFKSIRGSLLAEKFEKQIDNYKIERFYEEIISLNKEKKIFELKSNNRKILARSVIIASGSIEKELGIPGEKNFKNFGVSYCVICDGFLFKGKRVIICGGGYSAFESALYMSNIAEKVYIIHHSEEFKVHKETFQKVSSISKISIIVNSALIEIIGSKDEKILNYAKLINLITRETKLIEVSAVFPCIGLTPNIDFIKHLEIFDKNNYIKTKEDCSTSIAGLFAAGDVARSNKNKIRQIVTAISEGAISAQSAIKYLEKNR